MIEETKADKDERNRQGLEAGRERNFHFILSVMQRHMEVWGDVNGMISVVC